MLQVKVYMPAWYRSNEQFVADLSFRMKLATARCLRCDGPDGIRVITLVKDVGMMIFSYEDDARIGALLIIEVFGYDYPDRMADIDERLKRILVDSIPPEMVSFAGLKKASISFIPLRDGCWQVTAD